MFPSSKGKVKVVISGGTFFHDKGNPSYDDFAYFYDPPGDVPGVGEFKSDRFADLALFTRKSSADVWVAFNVPTADSCCPYEPARAFGSKMKAHDSFAFASEIPVPGLFSLL